MSALYDAVLVRFGSQYLVEMSNESQATTISTSVVEAACSDAQGEFHNVTGTSPDISNRVHLSALIKAVPAFLEYYKSRNTEVLSQRTKAAYASCKTLRETGYVPAQTNSPLSPSVQATGTRPDMDRNNPPFRSNAVVTLNTTVASGN